VNAVEITAVGCASWIQGDAVGELIESVGRRCDADYVGSPHAASYAHIGSRRCESQLAGYGWKEAPMPLQNSKIPSQADKNIRYLLEGATRSAFAAALHHGGAITMANASALIAGVMLTLGLFASSVGAEEERAADYVAISARSPCDPVNKSLWVVNTHPYKTIKVTVRWRAASGNFTMNDFFPSPNFEFEIGCASEAEILDAQFAGF
jgi:hypothetical protein